MCVISHMADRIDAGPRAGPDAGLTGVADLLTSSIAIMNHPKLYLLLLGSCLLAAPLNAGPEIDKDWWSLKPVVRPAVPSIAGDDAARARTPIDHFIIAKHAQEGLQLSPETDRRTLIRRLYFDLIGLPPSPEEVAAFVTDESADAYEKLVDKLLASPRYGERWARHWLDVVHYGDTHGYDKDKLRPNAYPYRDYVIRAFNDDKNYSRFVKEQLAGDVLWPDTVDGIVATGFIAAGPWDFIGHAEVPETKIDGKVARHLDRDDMVATTMNAFCSLTVQCAQCHDHKRDPVSMEDYYSLQAVFAALDRAERPYDEDPETAKKRVALTAQQKNLQSQLAEVDKQMQASKPPELVALEKEVAAIEKRLSTSQNVKGKQRSGRYGYHSQVAAKQDTVKWVQVDLGESKPIEQVVLFGADEYGFADFGFPHRFRVEVADDVEFKNPQVLADESGADFPRPGATAVGIDGAGKAGRYVRFTATKLWNRRQNGQALSNDWIFAVGELAVISAGQLVVVSEVTALDSIEAGDRWGKANLIDGIYGAYPLEAIIVADKSKTNGYHSQFAPAAETAKWVQIDLGTPVAVDRIELYPARPTDFKDTPGFGFPVRFKLQVSEAADGSNAQVFADHSAADFPNPGDEKVVFEGAAKQGRYVRISASTLSMPDGSGGHLLSMAEMRVFSAGLQVSHPESAVAALDTINSGLWHLRNLVDGFTSRQRIGGNVGASLRRLAETSSRELNEKLAAATEKRDELAISALDPVMRKQREEITTAIAQVSAELKPLAAPRMVYAGTVYKGSGTFLGRGHEGGKPRTITVLGRGDVTKPGKQVGAGTVDYIPDAPSRFQLPPDHAEGDRRVALADWIVHQDNPLTWRTIVNRVWLYHFGRGIVDSPNDFGRMGQLPTHPQLLDWLAAEFRDGNQSIKALHRLILNSAVYRQSSQGDGEAAKIDGSNRFLWRMNRRKLEAEAIRDTVLLVTGKLDTTMYGPGYFDFVLEKTAHSPHYEYHKHDPDDVKSHRRAIYRFLVRSQPAPFMDTLDCADPSLLVDKRNETLTALQALALLNNKFIVRMSEHFAEAVKAEKDPLARAIELTLSRQAMPDELDSLRAYAAQHGLAAACRVILNLNEFAFVD